MTADSQTAVAGPSAIRVTTLELFFDLVFVFTITQLTSVLVHDLAWRSLWHAVTMLAIVFWMYDGYAWLTNSVPAADPRRRVLLLAGMAGYLVIAISIPDAYGDAGVPFALGYLLVVLVHAFLYARTPSELSAAALRGLTPLNLLAAAAIVAGAAVGGTTEEVVWTVVAAALWLSMVVVHFGPFEIGPAHFVERHGLLVIVAIGESVVAIGVGAEGLDIDARLVLVVVTALALCAAMWWAYFGADEETAAEAAMASADDVTRTHMAQFGFGYAHLLILFGVIVVAVGIEGAIAHPGEVMSAEQAWALAGGVAIFVLGDVCFRWVLGLSRSPWRFAAPAVVLVSVPVATQVSATAGLVAATVLLAGCLVAEHLRTPR